MLADSIDISVPLIGSAIQLVMVAALTALALMTRDLRWRLAAALMALALLLVLPALHGAAPFDPVLPAQAAYVALLFALGAAGAGASGLSHVLPDRSRERRRHSDQAAQTGRAGEVVRRRLRNLLRKEHAKLETVSQMHRFFELATRNSQITMSFQDRELVYRWIVNARAALAPDEVIGTAGDAHLPEETRALVAGHKRRALDTGATQTFEVEIPSEEERFWFRVDVVPIAGGDGRPMGIVCTAIDITRSKRLDMMRTDLSRRLAETLQRFNLALRSERIMVFSQDLNLRYTWANSDETQVGSIIGRTDEEVIPEADRDTIVELKRGVISSKRPSSAEVGVGVGVDRRWYDLHVEPNMRPDGQVSGVTCASIDVTERKRNEEQMRLVLRELTHRTKNLLAVVIAIARQTAGQTDDVASYVPALVARLRALSAAQDLIVADDWAGVYIADLLNVLVGQYVPPQSSRVTMTGPPIMLSPEAAQNLGLAIHELAANASQYGAFSNTTGTLVVTWGRDHRSEGDRLRLEWREEGGPVVEQPTTRGFGTMVIERNLTRALGAEVAMRFDAQGLRATMTLPLDGVVSVPSPDRVRLAKVG